MRVAALRSGMITGATLAGLFSPAVSAQQPAPPTPVVVQPGAPGKPPRTLAPSTRATLPPGSPANLRFMQDMIMHHAKAVEMTDLIASHTENQHLRSLGGANQQLPARRNKVYETMAKIADLIRDALSLGGDAASSQSAQAAEAYSFPDVHEISAVATLDRQVLTDLRIWIEKFEREAEVQFANNKFYQAQWKERTPSENTTTWQDSYLVPNCISFFSNRRDFEDL